MSEDVNAIINDNTYYMYQVVHNSHILLECIEYNDWDTIQEGWNKKGLGVVMLSSNA